MKIIPCLLNVHNAMMVDDYTIGQWVQRQGKEHLWDTRKSTVVDTIVLHYISALGISPDDPYNLKTILFILCSYGLSSHYLIDRDGVVLWLVPENEKAWHAGGSIMPSPDTRTSVNDFSIGIEFVAMPGSGFTKQQYETAAGLCSHIERRWQSMIYVGHEHIAGSEAVTAGLRKDIKQDPGPLFEWDNFLKLRESTYHALFNNYYLGQGAC